MVPGLTIVFSAASLFLSLFLPIMLAVWFCRKYKAPASSVLFGALTFFFFQVVLRMPLLQLISPYYPGDLSNKALTGMPLFLYGLYLSATAALFEEGGRAVVCMLFLKGKGVWKNGVALGIGHGGFESMYIVGTTYINNLVLMFLINSGIVKSGSAADPNLANAIGQLINSPSYIFLLAGIERLLTITIHIGFSLLVVYGMPRRKYIYLLYSFAGHTLLNLPLIYSNVIPGGMYTIYGYIALFALLSLYWIIRISPKLFDITETDGKGAGYVS